MLDPKNVDPEAEVAAIKKIAEVSKAASDQLGYYYTNDQSIFFKLVGAQLAIDADGLPAVVGPAPQAGTRKITLNKDGTLAAINEARFHQLIAQGIPEERARKYTDSAYQWCGNCLAEAENIRETVSRDFGYDVPWWEAPSEATESQVGEPE